MNHVCSIVPYIKNYYAQVIGLFTALHYETYHYYAVMDVQYMGFALPNAL